VKHHVVVADDVAAVRAVVRATLEADGRFVVVGEAADGPSALDMVDALGPELLVLDLVMPGSEGLATLSEIVQRHPALGVVVCSDLIEQEHAALAAGARAFVRKSAEGPELLDALASAAVPRAAAALLPGGMRDFQRVVLDALDAGFVVQDASGRIVYANPAAERILGLTAESMLGLTSQDERWGAVDAQGAPLADDQHPIVLARSTGRTVRDSVMGVRRADGALRWVQVNAAPLSDGAEGPPLGAVASFTDVTAEVTATEALRASEERFRTAVETMLDGFMIWRAVRDEGDRIVDFVCEFANAAVVGSGYQPDELVGRRLLEVAPGLGDPELFARCVAVVEAGEPLRTELPWFEGERVEGAFEASVVRMGDGIALSYRDVTERVLAERSLRESEEQTRRFLEAIPLGVAVVEPGHVILANAAGRGILGQGVETDVRGPDLVEHFRLKRAGTGEPYPFDELPLARALFEGVAGGVDDLVIARADRDVPLETYAAPVRDASGEVRFALTVFSDITERRAQEAQLAAAHAELAAANEELTEFAAVAAHDLASPLRAIAGFAALLEEAYADALDDQGREWLGYLLSESDRMRAFIQELLAYSRAGAADAPRTVVDLGAIARGASEALRAEITEARARVEIGALPRVSGDPTRLGQVLQNLLANAIKFRDQGRAPTVTIDATRDADQWIVSVADDGVGVPEIDRARIFAPFFRGGSASEPAGHGLGLSICRRVVERHGGRIWVEPRAGGGSRFCFSLPTGDAVDPGAT